MTIRYAEARLPKAAAGNRARRAFWRGAAIFGLLGFVAGWLV